MTRSSLLVRAVVLTAACGSGDRSVLTAAGDEPVLHTGTVLQAPGAGPQLCLRGVADSLPPQCGGLPPIGWDWAPVDGEEDASGTTWGEYTVTGRYDGTTRTVTDPPVVAGQRRADDGETRSPPPARSRPRVGGCRTRPGPMTTLFRQPWLSRMVSPTMLRCGWTRPARRASRHRHPASWC